MEPKAYRSLNDLISSLLLCQGLSDLKSVLSLRLSDSLGIASERQNMEVELVDGSLLNLFLKVRKEGSEAEKYDEVYGLFSRERKMYEEILPQLNAFQEENDQNQQMDFQIGKMFPKYYGSGLVNNDLYLVFEDILINSGAFVTKKQEFHDRDKILLSLRQLGAFHGVSLCFERKTGQDVLSSFPILEEPVFHPERRETVRSLIEGNFKKNLKILDAVRKEFLKNNEIVRKNIESVCSSEDIQHLLLCGDNLMERIYELPLTAEDCSLIAHGDFHMWNIAFQGSPSLTKAVFFDLQSCRHCSGVTDIVQYLYQVTTCQERARHLTEYLGAYCESLSSSCRSLGLTESLRASSPDWVSSEYRRLSLLGLMYGIGFNINRFVEDQARFAEVSEAIAAEDSEKIVEIIGSSGSKMWWIVQIMSDTITDTSQYV